MTIELPEPVAYVCAPFASGPISMTCPVNRLDLLATMHNSPLYTAAQMLAYRDAALEEALEILNNTSEYTRYESIHAIRALKSSKAITDPAKIRAAFEDDDFEAGAV